MKQYCRYCGWLRDLGDGGPWYCEAKDKGIKAIKSANNCKEYGYCGLDEWQLPHTPKEFSGRKQYKHKLKEDSVDLFGGET